MMDYTIIKQDGFDCPWCTKAIKLLDDRGLKRSVKSLSKAALLKEAALAKMSSIPIIYHGDKLIGGHTELVAYLSEA